MMTNFGLMTEMSDEWSASPRLPFPFPFPSPSLRPTPSLPREASSLQKALNVSVVRRQWRASASQSSASSPCPRMAAGSRLRLSFTSAHCATTACFRRLLLVSSKATITSKLLKLTSFCPRERIPRELTSYLLCFVVKRGRERREVTSEKPPTTWKHTKAGIGLARVRKIESLCTMPTTRVLRPRDSSPLLLPLADTRLVSLTIFSVDDIWCAGDSLMLCTRVFALPFLDRFSLARLLPFSALIDGPLGAASQQSAVSSHFSFFCHPR